MLGDMNGQREAEFLDAYDRHADAIFRFVLFRVRDRDAAEDIVQETYMRTWRYLTEGKTIDEFRAFLYRTARNLIYDKTKQTQSRKTGSLDTFIDRGGDIAGAGAGEILEQLDGERALELLRGLEPPEYREAVYLRFIEDLPPREIAELLGENVNVISVRINRGIAKLKTLFPQ